MPILVFCGRGVIGALGICYELTTIIWNREFVAKTLNSSKLFLRIPDKSELTMNIYETVGTSRTDNDSTTNPENCQFFEIRGIRGRSVIGLLPNQNSP